MASRVAARDVGGAGATPLLMDESYTYDDTGNLTRIAGSPGERVFEYDALDRLTEACYDTTTCDGASDYVRWTYDAVGNRTNESRPTGSIAYTYAPPTGLLSSMSGPDGTTSFAYDALGQLKTETPAGSFACKLYKVDGDDGVTVRAWFATDLPGAPVRLEISRGDAVVTRMVLLQHLPG